MYAEGDGLKVLCGKRSEGKTEFRFVALRLCSVRDHVACDLSFHFHLELPLKTYKIWEGKNSKEGSSCS